MSQRPPLETLQVALVETTTDRGQAYPLCQLMITDRGAECSSLEIRRLVRGTGRLLAVDNRLRAAEDPTQIVIRWAEARLFTPAAIKKIEEALHRQHQARFGRPPKYS